jgi:hypothetical protein
VLTACWAGLTTICSAGAGGSLALAKFTGENIIHKVKSNPTNPLLISIFLIYSPFY